MEHKKPASTAPIFASNSSISRHGLRPSEIDIFKKSVCDQIDLLTKSELLNLIQIGHVTVDLQSISADKFTESNVHIIFSEFGPTLDHMINEWNLAWIIGFNYFHCHIFPTSDEEHPTNNPRWNDIASMDRSDLIAKLNDYMFPYFTDAFEICMSELFESMPR